MTTDNDLDAIFGEDPDSGQIKGSALRKQLEAVLAQNKALTEQLSAVQTERRESQVESLFAKHSIPALAKDFFPKDAELTDESATAFVEKYGQLWGAQAAESTATPEQQAAAAQVQALSAQAGTPPAGVFTEEAARARFAEAKTAEDVMRLSAEAVQGYSVVME